MTRIKYSRTLDSVCNSTPIPASHQVHAAPENETEASFFNRELYDAFKDNPKVLIVLETAVGGINQVHADKLGLLSMSIMMMYSTRKHNEI